VKIADDPGAMINRAMELYSDEQEWNRASKAGLDFVAQHNSFEMGMRKVSEVIDIAEATHRRDGR
jgi:hypothetical protein